MSGRNSSSEQHGIVSKFFSHLDSNPKMVYIHLLICLVCTAEGFVLSFSIIQKQYTHLPLWLTITVFLFGLGYTALIIKYLKSRSQELDTENITPILMKINKYLPLNNKIVSILIGVIILFTVFIYNYLTIGRAGIGDIDIIIILVGLMFLVYPFVPSKYQREKDFVLVFLVLVSITLAIIPFIFGLVAKNYTYYFLSLPVTKLLNLVGVDADIVNESMIIYALKNGGYSAVIIARSCSGIYSFSIFVSAFTSFVLVEYQKFDLKVNIFLVMGVAIAYLGNIIRMTVTILVGHYSGTQALIWTHENLGHIIFIAWTIFFWWLMYKFIMKGDAKSDVS